MLNLMPWREQQLKRRTLMLTALYLTSLALAALVALWLNTQQTAALNKLNDTQQAITSLRVQNQNAQQQLNLLQKSQQNTQQMPLIADKVRFVDFMQWLSALTLQHGQLTLAELDASRLDQQLLLEGEQLSEQEFEQLQTFLASHWLDNDSAQHSKLTHFVADHDGINFRLVSGVMDE
ncbi:hypothetical protein HPC38_01190 [Pasteurellaceae bacterium HPA106]|uniref:hypothetical protein n=1 Tax=Spirabiliibacterium pneumoniae TaxID=221400 RepID=UPI001AAD621D|nr:hypothetical protein [Spirabiliibacterium pneumoniae]MBE2895496.1 hypothetical protein [Spirabiliibacterium pneumoniae]